VQDVSLPGIKERADSLGNFASTYPVLFSFVVFLIFIFMTIRECKKEKGRLIKVVVYSLVALIAFWRVAITI